MSAVLQEAATPANDETVEVLDRAEITDGKALVSYSRTEAGLLALKEDLAGKVYDLTTVKGNELARQDRQRCVTLRTSLEKKRLEFKRPVLDIGKMIDSEAKRITDEILKLEAPIDAAIKADEARREKIRAEKAAAEAARQQKHRDGIALIRSYAETARRPDMTAERLLKGLSALEAMVIDPAAWEEFATEAAHVLAETTAAVKAEHAALVEREAEAARLARQAKEQAERQAELDRIAAEQAAQAEAIAAQQAEIARQAEALAEQQRAAEAAEAQPIPLLPKLANSVKSHPTHGFSQTPEYRAWQCMRKRCTDPENAAWPNYGGRGITVCESWMTDVSAFVRDMGAKPSEDHELDRIDNDGSYSPENCRWVLRSENNRNKSNNRFVEWQGQRKTLVEWSEITGLSYWTLRSRIDNGWPVDRAMTERVKADATDRETPVMASPVGGPMGAGQAAAAAPAGRPEPIPVADHLQPNLKDHHER